MVLAVHMVWTCIANLSHGVIWSHQILWIRDTDYIFFSPLTLVDLMQLSLTGDHLDVMFLFLFCFFPWFEEDQKARHLPFNFSQLRIGRWFLWCLDAPLTKSRPKSWIKKDDEAMIMDPPKSFYFMFYFIFWTTQLALNPWMMNGWAWIMESIFRF